MRSERLSVAGPVFAGDAAVLVVQRGWLVAEGGAGRAWLAGALTPLAVVVVRLDDVRAWPTAGEPAVDVDELKRRVPGLERELSEARSRLAAGR